MSRNTTPSGFDDRVGHLKESMRGMVDYGGERASAIKNRLADVKDSMVSGGSSAMQRVGAAVKEHPFIALGIAFGVGYLAIRIARR